MHGYPEDAGEPGQRAEPGASGVPPSMSRSVLTADPGQVREALLAEPALHPTTLRWAARLALDASVAPVQRVLRLLGYDPASPDDRPAPGPPKKTSKFYEAPCRTCSRRVT